MSNSPQKPTDHVWYYRRTALFDFVEEGPFTQQQLIKLAAVGKLSLTTPIKSPTGTNGQWIDAEKSKALAIAINQYKIDSHAAKQQAVADKKQAALDVKRSKHELAVLAQQEKIEKLRAQEAAKEREAAYRQTELASYERSFGGASICPSVCKIATRSRGRMT